MAKLTDYFEETRVIAIIRGIPSEKCVQTAEALYEGGIRLVEVTFQLNKPDSWVETSDSIKAIKKTMGNEMCVGAGTVTSTELVDLSYAAGAEFIVSPNTEESIIRKTKELGMYSFPGAMTPSEVVKAHNAGADYVKLFPAANLGCNYIKAIKSPLSNIGIIAVGGVNEKNASEFINAGAFGVGVGGNLVNKSWISNGQYYLISKTAKELISNIKR